MSKRRRFSPEQKAAIVRRQLAGTEPVSDLAEDVSVQPSQIHLWVKQLLDQADRAFHPNGHRNSGTNEVQQRQASLEAALARKDALLADLALAEEFDQDDQGDTSTRLGRVKQNQCYNRIPFFL